MNIPNSLILDFTSELKEFRCVVSELDMPSIDMESALQQIVDSTVNLATFDDKIAEVAMYMGQGEGIYEGLFENSEAEIHDDVQQRITMAVLYLGRAIKNKLINYNAYSQGQLPYNFRNYINDRTIVLSTPPAGSSNTEGARQSDFRLQPAD